MAQNKYMAQSLYDEQKTAKKASSSRPSERSGAVSDSKLRSEFQRYKRDTEIELEELRRRGIPATGTGTPGAPGKDGKDGVGIRSVTQEVVSEESGGENVVAVELTDSSSYRFTVRNGKQGEKGDAGLPGAKGDKGDKGDAGKDGTSVTIASVSTSTADGGSNVVTFSDGNTVTVKNGSKGDKGDQGDRGESGVYIGSGDMPSDCSVQIDPDGVAVDLEEMVNDALYANVGLFKGESGKDGKDGQDGTVTFDELTDAQKSQLTEGITEDLASKMQNESLSAVKITASGLFAEEAHATMVSAETFTPETLKNFTVIDKCAVTNGNYYNRGILVGLRKDNSNYIALSVSAYTITLDNVVSGVKTTKTYGSVKDSITNASDVCSRIDLVRKKVEMHALINGVNTVIVDEDISGYDLSGLDVFKLETGAGKFRGYQYNIYARINDYFDCVGLMQYHFSMSDYNALPVENGVKEVYDPTGLNLSGTITNTISATHKISSAEMSAENYFAMQMTNPSMPVGANFTTRFRIKSKSDDMYIKIGAGASQATIVDESGVCVWSVQSGANTQFYPDVNKWYYLVTTIPGQGANYSSAYGMRTKGTFTIEAEALYGCGARSQNMCAETWNGQYFTGALPFKGIGVKFVAYNNFPYNGTLGGNYTPIKATRMDASGYIAMYNGSEWITIGTR